MSKDLSVLSSEQIRELVENLPVRKRPAFTKALEAAAQFAKNRKEYQQAVDLAIAVLENEWWLGKELPNVLARPKGGQPKKNCKNFDSSFLLSELGISRTRSSLAQEISKGFTLPQLRKWANEVVEGYREDTEQPPMRWPRISSAAGEAKRRLDAVARDEAREILVETFQDDDGVIEQGDFLDVASTIPDDSIELIFTDPPYFTSDLPLYDGLGKIAVKVLVQGGSLITYCGHASVAKVVDLICGHGLRFYWTCACIHTGQSARLSRSGIVAKWKPMLWFVKGGERFDTSIFVDDAVISEPMKTDHEWQQSEIEAAYYIGKLSSEGGTVFDPFCGSGTTAAAAKRLNRRFITCDKDGAALQKAIRRIDAI